MYRSAMKVDLDGVDFPISGTTPTLIPWSRVRWDLNGDFLDGHFYPPVDGLYFSGSVLVLKSLVGVSVAVVDLYRNGVFYQRLDQGTAILRGAAIVPGLQSGTDYLDLYVSLLGVSPSAVVDGASAWSTFFYTSVSPTEIF